MMALLLLRDRDEAFLYTTKDKIEMFFEAENHLFTFSLIDGIVVSGPYFLFMLLPDVLFQFWLWEE